jgi:flavorubredoxin/flavin reductase (DIM6/NTAB) family NADH-FMN oxidoreductase RutF
MIDSTPAPTSVRSAVDRQRDVQVQPIAAGTTIFRSRSWSRLRFEVEYARERGTTANSYFIQGDRTALIDPPGASFTEIFLAALQDPTPDIDASRRLPFWSELWARARWVTQQHQSPRPISVNLQQLDYIILGHVNPNRVETLKTLLDRAPQATIVCSNPTALSLRDLMGDRFLKVKVMRGDDGLDLGQGHVLQFIPTPTPRYPDSLCTYDKHTQILFTDKLFGSHVCSDQVIDEGSTELSDDRRYYFDCLMAPHARQVETALDKLAQVSPVRFYAPGHGPLVRDGLMELTHNYRRWCQQQKGQDIMVALLYASAYGNTATLAQAIARGLTKSGVRVESINCEVTDPQEIQSIVEQCSGFLIGSPTLGGHAPTQIQTALGIILSNVSTDKLAGAFGSFGWSGEAIDLLDTKLRDAGYSFGFEPIRVKFKPTDAVLKSCEEAGTDFAQVLKKAKRRRQPRSPSGQPGVSTLSSTEQAVGRLVGSLCVVTVKHGDVSSAMLASWVSQATFTPPGFTIAVAKDRAIESLLYPGSEFVLNILPEGDYLAPMKHFLKPFAPGEDRFTGVNTQPAKNGSPILMDALAYLECRVESRMECGDHWVVYAVIDAGAVLNPDGKTAVHHRKAGTHY